MIEKEHFLQRDEMGVQNPSLKKILPKTLAWPKQTFEQPTPCNVIKLSLREKSYTGKKR